MKESELYRIAEAVIVRDSLTLFMNKLTEQHKGHPDYGATMKLCRLIYRKYHGIAQTPVEYDALGYLTVKRDVRRGKYDMN
jgi:hypothetical protein